MMKRTLLVLACFFLPACAFFQRPFRPVHAPPVEADRVEFPMEIPAEGRQIIRGPMATAIQLAMDDFIPRDLKLPREMTPEERCLHQRESYDVITAPGPEGIMFVRLTLGPEACKMSGTLLDMEIEYAIDVKGWRILAIKK
jgi:hypothetical protein